MRLEFIKMQAGGNDFVVLDGTGPPSHKLSELVGVICDRHLGVGSDGAVWLDWSNRDQGTILRVHCFNSDGSRAAICINAFRCAALRARQLDPHLTRAFLRSDMGPVVATFNGEEVEIQLPTPSGQRVELPSWAPARTGYFVWTGDPHLVLPLLSGEMIPAREFSAEAGRLRRWRGLWRDGTNVHFVTHDDLHWTLRSYERGVEGETLSCGSGSLAAAYMLYLAQGRIEPTSFRTAGGAILTVRFKENCWMMSGPARVVYRGEIELEERSRTSKLDAESEGKILND